MLGRMRITWLKRTRPFALVLIAAALAACGAETSTTNTTIASPRSSAPATSSTTAVDPYGTDPVVVRGTRDEVCQDGAAADRPGRAALAAHIDATWPQVLEVMGYECREINDPTQPECQRRVAPERSDCWSTHAAGRAIDVVVGGEADAPTPEGVALGDEIVDAFLAPRDGVDHHLARVTGVQEIIWNGHCWHPDDPGVTSAAAMEPCAIRGHANHVHLTLSDAGADGRTSWHARDRAPGG